jgi:glutamate mutase epsilon subunit
LTPQAKREFLEIYRVQVAAARGKYVFCCFADMLLSSQQYDEEFETAFTAAVKEFEKRHPDLTLADLVDYSKVLPEDIPWARFLNDAKKRQKALWAAKKTQSSTKRLYTTIERTSA